VTIGVASDKGLMPDPETLLEGFEDEFNYLIDIVQSGKINQGPLVLHDRFVEKKSTAEKDLNKDKPQDKEAAEESKPVQCEAYTKAGKRCRNKAVNGTAFCSRHRQYQEEGSLLRDVRQIMRDLSD